MYIFVSRVFLIRRPFRPALAAAHGGYCRVCAMPNLDPAPDSLQDAAPSWSASAWMRSSIDALRCDHRAPRRQGACGHGAVAPYVAGFFRRRQRRAGCGCDARRDAQGGLGKHRRALGEDNTLLHGGYIHDGAYARAHGHKGISSESEWRQLERDLELVRERRAAPIICATCPPRRAWRLSVGRRRRGWMLPARPRRTTSC